MLASNPTHAYKGQPVELLELTYEHNGKQYCTIKLKNRLGKIQRQTVQFDKLQPLPEPKALKA